MDERVWPKVMSECCEEAERWRGYADIRVDYAANIYTYITSIPSPLAGFMTHVTCRLTAKNRDSLRNATLGNRVLGYLFTRTSHSFIPGLKPSFSANPSHRSLPFHLRDWLHGFPGLFTDSSENNCFFTLSFFLIFFTFYLLVPCGRLSWLMSAFGCTLK